MEKLNTMKTIQQIKDCQAIDLGYNSFRSLVLNPKKDMFLDHLNLCIKRSMLEYANQKLLDAIEILNDGYYCLPKEVKIQVDEYIEETSKIKS